MKNLLYFLFIISFLACSNGAASLPSNRERAIEKQGEAVRLYIKYIFHEACQDSLQLALNLLDESIALDTTFVLAYDTKRRFLNEQGRYSEAMEVIELIIFRNLKEQMPDIFLTRGMQQDKLNHPELAQLDYQKSITLCDTIIKQEAKNYQALTTKALAIYLSKGKKEGIRMFEEILDRKFLTDTERYQVEMVLDAIKSSEKVITEWN